MKPTFDGGPAFPMPSGPENVYEHGMTLRDYFAAKAMNGITSRSSCNYSDDQVAQIAYRYADAMLKAREGGAS